MFVSFMPDIFVLIFWQLASHVTVYLFDSERTQPAAVGHLAAMTVRTYMI